MRRFAFAACLLSACSFEPSATNAGFETNRCNVDADCSGMGLGSTCSEGMCTARASAMPLDVALEISIPQPTESGAQTFLIKPFEVQEPVHKSWELPVPLRVHGQVRKGDTLVEAEVAFVPMEGLAGRTPSAVSTLTATLGTLGAGMDYEVAVTSGGKHTMIVKPTDLSLLPPVVRPVDLSESSEQSLRYEELELPEVELELDGVPEDRVMLLRAVDRLTGERISTVARVEGGKAKLIFGAQVEGYRLLVSAEQSYDREPTSAGSPCQETPALPTFSIDSDDFPSSSGSVKLTLPQVPERIRYEGSIKLCEAGKGDLPNLPVTLRSTTVDLLDGDPGWSAEVTTDAAAMRDSDSRFSLCVDILPGDYSIVVTPPATLPCEQFAEQRVVRSPTSPLIELVDSSVLVGEVESFDDQAIASAVIEAQSLGREGAVDLLPHETASLTGYNRSRQTTTDEAGKFSLPIDIGTYDVTVRPPASSGFAWVIYKDITIGRSADSTLDARPITMNAPLALECEIAISDEARASLAGAEITAYAEVPLSEGGVRSLPIGTAVANEDGVFTLLLPAAIQDEL